MRFFKKVGRPTDEEQMIMDAIGSIIKEKGLSENDVPECHNLEDLLTAVELLEAMESSKTKEPEPIILEQEPDDDNLKEDELTETVHDITKEVESSDDLHENLEDLTNEEFPSFENSDYDPFAEPIVERTYTGQTSSSDSEKDESNDDDLNLSENGDTPLDDLHPRTKQRAAEQTADAILKGYKNFAPEPFKWWCKFPESKIERLAFEGELDPNIEVEKGVSFEAYIQQTNEQIDEIFEVQQETLDEIKEPLVEVLLEQELELTPQQRLGMAVLSHLLQMFTMAMKLWGQNKRILEYQKHLTQLAYQARADIAGT